MQQTMKRKKNSGATKRESNDDEEKKAPLLPLRKNARRCRELGVELNTDATKLNNASQLLSILMSTSPSPPAASSSLIRRTREEEEREDALLFKTNTARDDKERDEEQRQKAKVESMLALEKFFAARLARGDVALARRDLLLSKKKKIREEDDGNDINDVAEQKKRKYRAWLLQNYKLFLSRMIRVAAKDRTASEQTRVVAFSGLMEIARLDGGGEDGDEGGSSSSNFNNEIFERALEECVRSKLWSDATLGMLKKRFLGRVDVQYYAYKAVARIAGRLAAASRKESGSTKTKKEGKDMDDDDDDEENDAGNGADMEASSAEVARNLYDVISNVSVDFEDYDPESTTTNPILNSSNNGGAKLTSKEVDFAAMLGLSSEDLAKAAAASNNNNEDDDDGKAETTPWCKMPSQTLDIDEQNDAKRRKKSNEKDLKKKKAATKTKNGSKISWMDGVKRRRAFSDAWIAFLRLPNFPEDVYRKILARLHLDVIPHHVNPVLLCDFCVSSVNVGGLIGMLALHALFVLVTRHNLEYPKFYDRLYNLINEDSFYANGRRTFFELADVFLKSPALPGYCAAAFCKKFGRLSLSAPPAGAMLCVSFIHNLIRRHPKSCLPLIHRDRDVLGGSGGGVNIDNADEDNTATEGDENVKQKSSSNKHRKSFDEDPYDFSTEDPAKSRALESSLWEMTALENHYFPQVTKLVQMLRMDLGDRVKTKEIDISGGGEAQHSLCSANYYSLLKEELDVRLKSVALKHGTIGDLGLFHSDEFVSAAGFGELIQWKED